MFGVEYKYILYFEVSRRLQSSVPSELSVALDPISDLEFLTFLVSGLAFEETLG